MKSYFNKNPNRGRITGTDYVSLLSSQHIRCSRDSEMPLAAKKQARIVVKRGMVRAGTKARQGNVVRDGSMLKGKNYGQFLSAEPSGSPLICTLLNAVNGLPSSVPHDSSVREIGHNYLSCGQQSMAHGVTRGCHVLISNPNPQSPSSEPKSPFEYNEHLRIALATAGAILRA
jgi:hypothetical protein